MKRLITVGVAACLATAAHAQTAQELSKSDPSYVLNYGMDYGQQRYSALAKINAQNVKHLAPAWNLSYDDNRAEESQPLVYKGVLYVTTNSATIAVDAKTGKQLWKTKVEYPPETPRVVCCGIINRGAAMYEGKIIRGTLDAKLVALDAKTGKQLWKSDVAEMKAGYTMTGAPQIADGVILTGISGAEFGTRDFIDGWDPADGKHLWRTYTVPLPNEKGGDTWAGDTAKTGGGSTWITGSFDPELHTVYWGIGNPGPFNAAGRKGDNLYTCSVLALDPKTGAIKWHYQFSPNNPFDYDSVAEMILSTIEVKGKPTKVLIDANRNGFIYVLDRTNGKLIAANPYVKVNWASSIDMATGRPVETEISTKARNGETGRRVAVDPWRQELGTGFVRPEDRPCLLQHAQLRRSLQGRAGRIQGRRMVSRHGPDPWLGLPRRSARLPEGRRSDDGQGQVGSAERSSAVLGRVVDRRRGGLLGPTDRRVRGV